MPSHLPPGLLRLHFEDAAQAYLRSLPPEHFMEATAQATQRAITLACLALLRAFRPDFQLFNELLVQYPFGRDQKIRQVVPDNMVVLWDEPIKAEGSFDVPFQPVRPFWVLEYVSKSNRRKDYDDSFRKYERELKVPYYLLFVPDAQELTLYRHNRRKYVTTRPDDNGRYPIPELELALGLLDGWVRYWFRGELLPLPVELLRARDEERQARLAAERELAELRAQLEQLRLRPQRDALP